MREAFSNALVRLASADPRVLLLTGDHGYALFDEFRKRCPDQYINAGIAEQNMVGMAAGLARSGFRPFVYGLSSFVPIRVLEQIKLDVAHDRLPVAFVGDGAGFVYSHLGTSHQSTEDIACLRAVPNICILSPADRFEMAACMDYAHELAAPVYLRMGKSDRGDVHRDAIQMPPGRLVSVMQGLPGAEALIATGAMVRTAIEVAQELLPGASVWSAPMIKPLHEGHVAEVCGSRRAVITLEEHSTLGGLGSVIAEIASEHAPVRLLRIGVADRFSELCGTYEYLLSEHGLDRHRVGEKIRAFLGAR